MVDLSIKDALSKVEKFHNAFGIKNNFNPTSEIEIGEIELRHLLMQEENDEYLEAARNKDIVEIADALGDQLYILCGTILKHGMQDLIVEVFEEIQRSNMSKLDLNGKPIYREDGKVLKGENYFGPDIKSILEKNLEK
jgi:predicted HAD superfamily Cof-like phosphohydrolase